MFFMMGITDGRKDFEYNRMIVCDACGAYGRYVVFMTYTVLSLFFIPCFKWNKRYFVRTTCCESLYELDAEIGARIARGEDIEILAEHLKPVQLRNNPLRKCANCGYQVEDHFEFCPKCGNKL